MSTNDIVNEIEGNYELWDNKLNEIYSTLKVRCQLMRSSR